MLPHPSLTHYYMTPIAVTSFYTSDTRVTGMMTTRSQVDLLRPDFKTFHWEITKKEPRYQKKRGKNGNWQCSAGARWANGIGNKYLCCLLSEELHIGV